MDIVNIVDNVNIVNVEDIVNIVGIVNNVNIVLESGYPAREPGHPAREPGGTRHGIRILVNIEGTANAVNIMNFRILRML